MTFCYTFNLVSYTLNKAKHNTKSYNKGGEVKKPNMRSVPEHTVEMRPRSSAGQLSVCAVYYVLAVEDLYYAQRSIRQSLCHQLSLQCGEMWKGQYLESLTVCCKSPPFLNEFNQSWAFGGLFSFCWLSVLGIIWASVLISAISGLSHYALGCLSCWCDWLHLALYNIFKQFECKLQILWNITPRYFSMYVQRNKDIPSHNYIITLREKLIIL